MTYLKPIKVGYTSYETFIDDDTIQQVEALLAGNTYCQTCKQKFTDMRPEVSKSTCLGCFILRHSELENTGKVGIRSASGETLPAWLEVIAPDSSLSTIKLPLRGYPCSEMGSYPQNVA